MKPESPQSASHRKPGPRVLVISHDIVDTSMAGPGIRSLELARVLARSHPVVLAMPNDCEIPGEEVHFHPYRHGEWETLAGAVEEAGVIVTSGFSLHEFPPLRAVEAPVVIDLYDPFPLENLSLVEHLSRAEQGCRHRHDREIIEILCERGDFFICAHERQRDWWLGVLQAEGRINPATTRDDPTLRSLIDEVPFGLPARPFAQAQRGPGHLIPGVPPEAKVILWGGGLWDWLDPATLIRAMPAVLAVEPHARLLFPGTRHPNTAVPEMKRAVEARALSRELELDHAVIFGEWVPYALWPSYLAEADVAVSLHQNTLETRFSAVRSRILSYIWAGLPMVVTEGDAASRLVTEHALGEVVPYGDVERVAGALITLLKRGKEAYSTRFTRLAGELTWERAAEPLLRFCAHPSRSTDSAPEWQDHLAGGQGKVSTEANEDALSTLRRELDAQTTRVSQLEATIEAYQSGRFITLMRRLKQLRPG